MECGRLDPYGRFMQRRRNTPRSVPSRATTSAELELPPDRAFVLNLDLRARLPREMVGRVEHVISGQVAHVTSVDQLITFMAKVLRSRRSNAAVREGIWNEQDGRRTS